MREALDTKPREADHSSSVLFIAFVVFVDMMGVSIIIPVMPDLIQSLTGVGIGQAAEIGGYLFVAYAVMQFLFAPLLGALSDRFGRRPVILIALAGLAVDYLIMALAPTLFFLFVGRVLSGIMGATWPAANAYIADISDSETRAKNFGLVAGAAGAGFVLGPVFGGGLAYFGLRAPFFAAAGFILIAAIYGLRVLPETLPKDLRRRFEWGRANPVGGLLQIGKYRAVLGILLAFFLMQFAWTSFSVVWPYFTIERFAWSKFEIGVSVTLYGLLIALVQGVLTGPVTARFGTARVGGWSLVLGIAIYMSYAFVAQGWVVYILILVAAPTAFAGPVMQTLMTERVGEDQQGELQGVIASAMGVTAIFGPYTMTQVFRAYVADEAPVYFPGAPFLLSAGLIVVCLVVFSVSTGAFRSRLGRSV